MDPDILSLNNMASILYVNFSNAYFSMSPSSYQNINSIIVNWIRWYAQAILQFAPLHGVLFKEISGPKRKIYILNNVWK